MCQLYKTYKAVSCFALLFMLFFVGGASNFIKAQTANTDDNQVKLGLVLGGGGAKGFAHIGVLKVLEEENIPITLISGNSIGTIVGALYSCGYSAQEIEDFAREQDWEMLLLDEVSRKLKSPFKQKFEHKYLLQLNLDKEDKKLSLPSGYVKGNNILNLFSRVTANIPDSIDFYDLPIPFSCVAYNIETGKEEVLRAGHLPTAMLSSMAFPGVVSPVVFNGMTLVDGGVINNFPVDVAKDMGADIIIGVDLKQEQDKSSDSESIASVLIRIINNIGAGNHDMNTRLADVVINPKIKGVSTFDFNSNIIDSVMKQGELAAREQMPKIKELIKGLNIKRNNSSIAYKHKDKWYIKNILINSEQRDDYKIISATLGINPNASYSLIELEEAVKRVYAYGNFEGVNYKLKRNGEGYDFELIIRDKQESKIMIGAGLNTVDLASIYTNYSKQNYSAFFSLLMIDTKIAANPVLTMKMETNRTIFSTIGMELSARYNNLNVYDAGHQAGKIDIVNIATSLYTNWRLKKTIDTGIGLSQHYFNGNIYKRESERPTTLFLRDASGFYTTLFGQFTVDSRDRISLPREGFYLNTKLSFLVNKGNFSNIIPISFLKINTIFPIIDENVLLLANLHHRTILNSSNQTVAFANYAANEYNAYSPYSFPVLGQRGMSYLQPVATLAEIGVRLKLNQSNYLTPRVQLLSQFDEWTNIGENSMDWGLGVTYQSSTKFGPIDFTLGYQYQYNDFNFFGGFGYQF